MCFNKKIEIEVDIAPKQFRVSFDENVTTLYDLNAAIEFITLFITESSPQKKRKTEALMC